MNPILSPYKIAVEKELAAILHYWATTTPDAINGGFIGKVDPLNRLYPEAPKGAVLHSRILWTFAAAYNCTGNRLYLPIAERAFNYLRSVFMDPEYGGVYWLVTANGKPLDTKKQIYAQAFALYGLSEYSIATNDPAAKEAAIGLFYTLEQHSYDEQYGGYFEAFARNWEAQPDVRLSDKDANEKKSMNTHLHVLEAYSNLHRIWPVPLLKHRLTALIRHFLDHIISKEDHHLILFFAEDWSPRSTIISYGHDIEASWLLQEAAEQLEDKELLDTVKLASLRLAQAAAEGLDKDGGLWYEYEPATHHLIKEKHWWPQAEALVGFMNAWQLTGEQQWLDRVKKNWSFIQQYIKDPVYGEWHWGVQEDHSPMKKHDKVGVWKCPYHNGRACIELIKRSSS